MQIPEDNLHQLFGLDCKFNVFNIGSDHDELSIKELAEKYLFIGKNKFNYSGSINYAIHSDKEYLIDNPNRRCPDISKARRILNYNPAVRLEEGLTRYLEYLNSADREEYEW